MSGGVEGLTLSCFNDCSTELNLSFSNGFRSGLAK